VAFLEQLARSCPVGPVVLALDNVVTHDAKLVRAWPARPEHARFGPLRLPRYTLPAGGPVDRT